MALPTKNWTRLERLDRDKRSSLLQKSLNYGHKKFYEIDPRTLNVNLKGNIFASKKTFNGRLDIQQNAIKQNDIMQNSAMIYLQSC